MKLHRNCITDRLAQEYWRSYQAMVREGNPMGLSFTEYIAMRVQPQTVTATNSPALIWYAAPCGHSHPWGESCATWTTT